MKRGTNKMFFGISAHWWAHGLTVVIIIVMAWRLHLNSAARRSERKHEAALEENERIKRLPGISTRRLLRMSDEAASQIYGPRDNLRGYFAVDGNKIVVVDRNAEVWIGYINFDTLSRLSAAEYSFALTTKLRVPILGCGKIPRGQVVDVGDLYIPGDYPEYFKVENISDSNWTIWSDLFQEYEEEKERSGRDEYDYVQGLRASFKLF